MEDEMLRAIDLRKALGLFVLVAASISVLARSATCQLPSDVRSNHWAASAVQQILKSGVLSVLEDHQFHGEAHVTHLQAVVALAAVSKKLLAGTWTPGESTPVPGKVAKTLANNAWESKPVTRYELASVLVRFGNYFTKAVPRPKPNAKDLGASEILPSNVKTPVQPGNPAYDAYKFLSDGRMITPKSPLLKADSQFLKAGELSRGVADAAAGISDKLTELGHDESGNTPDKSFHPKKP
jgi:hypothetical protein